MCSTTKRCSRCKEEWSINDYYKGHAECKACYKEAYGSRKKRA